MEMVQLELYPDVYYIVVEVKQDLLTTAPLYPDLYIGGHLKSPYRYGAEMAAYSFCLCCCCLWSERD